MAAKKKLAPVFFVDQLIAEMELNQMEPVRQYFLRHRGKKVVLGTLKLFKNDISEIERCFFEIQKHIEPLSTQKKSDYLNKQYIKCAESIHKLLYDTNLAKFLNLVDNTADLIQTLPAYIFDHPSSTEEPAKLVEKSIEINAAFAAETVPTIKLIDDIIKAFTNSERKNKDTADTTFQLSLGVGAGVGVAAGVATGIGASVATSVVGTVFAAGVTGAVAGASFGPGAIVCIPIGIVGGVASGLMGALIARNTSNIIAKTSANDWPQNFVGPLVCFLRNRDKNTSDLQRKLQDRHAHNGVGEIREDILGWINKTRKKISALKGFEIHCDIISLQLEQSWSLAKAILTQKKSHIQESAKRFQELKRATEQLPVNAQLVCSIGYHPQNGQKIQLVTRRRIPSQIIMTDICQEGNWCISSATSTSFVDVVAKVFENYTELQKAKIGGIFIGDFSLKKIPSSALNEQFNVYYPMKDEDASIDGNFVPETWEGALSDKYGRGGKPYYCPKGWHRISMTRASDREDFDRKYADWPIAYHGTREKCALDIILSGLITGEGVCLDNMIRQQGLVYLSPSIIYTAHPRYS